MATKPLTETDWLVPDVKETPEGPVGTVAPATGLETKPCCTCASWANDQRRLIQHLRAQGLVPDAQGFYETPIAREIRGRKSLRMNPRDYGYCNRECSVTHMLASCENWRPTIFAKDLAGKIR